MLYKYEIAVTIFVKKPLHVAIYRMTLTCNHMRRNQNIQQKKFYTMHRTQDRSTKRKYKICVLYLQTKQNISTHRTHKIEEFE